MKRLEKPTASDYAKYAAKSAVSAGKQADESEARVLQAMKIVASFTTKAAEDCDFSEEEKEEAWEIQGSIVSLNAKAQVFAEKARKAAALAANAEQAALQKISDAEYAATEASRHAKTSENLATTARELVETYIAKQSGEEK